MSIYCFIFSSLISLLNSLPLIKNERISVISFVGAKLTEEKVQANAEYSDAYINALNKYLKMVMFHFKEYYIFIWKIIV